MAIIPPAIMNDVAQTSQRLTVVRFPGGLTVVAPTDQWIACLFDVLHPSQQEAIIQRIKGLADAQRDRPMVEIPGFSERATP